MRRNLTTVLSDFNDFSNKTEQHFKSNSLSSFPQSGLIFKNVIYLSFMVLYNCLTYSIAQEEPPIETLGNYSHPHTHNTHAQPNTYAQNTHALTHMHTYTFTQRLVTTQNILGISWTLFLGLGNYHIKS